MLNLYHPHLYVLCYEGEGDGDGGNGGDTNNSANGGDTTRTFTQEEVNQFLANDKRKHQEKYQQLETSYQELLQNRNLSNEEREKLEARLEDVQKSLRTKEQEAEHQRKKAELQYKNELEAEKNRADHWENLFKQETVARSLQDAAQAAEAFNPAQIVGLLKPYTELKDVEGILSPMVDFPDISEKTGEEIRTLRTPADAVKRMRELPQMYGNLFKSNVVSGVGAGNASASLDADAVDYSGMSSSDYMKNRDKIKERMARR